MSDFSPRTPDWEARCRASFGRQSFMGLIGAELVRLLPGEAEILLSRREDLLQQHGYFHAGTTTSIGDSAAGYAALTLFDPGFGVLTTELKINLLAPARGDRLLARGRVLKSGRTLTVCAADVFVIDRDETKHVATALLTMMAVAGLED